MRVVGSFENRDIPTEEETMQVKKLISRAFMVMALGLLASAGVTAQEVALPPDGGGGGCANTICGGVTYCEYGAGYSCSMTSSSCTNRFC
jgi:hypothetical protein